MYPLIANKMRPTVTIITENSACYCRLHEGCIIITKKNYTGMRLHLIYCLSSQPSLISVLLFILPGHVDIKSNVEADKPAHDTSNATHSLFRHFFYSEEYYLFQVASHLGL